MLLDSTFADLSTLQCSGQQPVCASCKKRGRVCQWTPLKASKCRRSGRKPYDAWIPYHPPIAPKAPERSYVVAPRPAYPSPSVMLPWSIDGTGISLAQAASMTTAPMVETMMQQSFTICSTHTQYGLEGLDIHPQCLPYSLSSLRSDSSTCESAPPHTPRTPRETPTSAGPSSSPMEDVPQEIPSNSDIEALFRELYQRVSPKWSSLSSDEFEKLFAQ